MLAATLELGRDEAAYWYWAWHGLDASYSWVTGAFVRLSTTLAGDGVFAVRLPGLLAGFATIGIVFMAARRLGATVQSAHLAALAVAASPWQTYAGTVVHPDAFLTLFLVVTADRLAAVRLDPERAGRHALIAASACVLASLTKLTGAILLPVVALLLLRSRLRPGALVGTLAILASGAVVLGTARDPLVLAGVREFGRFAPSVGLFERAAIVLAGIAVFGGPALVLAARRGVRGLAKGRDDGARPAQWIAVAMLVFFVAFFVSGQAKSNWFLPAFVLLLPSAAVNERRMRGLGASLALSLLLVLGWTLPAVPAAWSALVARLPAAANTSYERHLGDRERNVSPTRSWATRVEEYHRSSAVDDTERALGGFNGPIVSNDYGLAFRVAHRLGRDRLVRLPWDPVFARTCRRELRRGDDVGFVSASWERAPAVWASGFRAALPREAPAGDRGVHVVEYLDWRGIERHVDTPAILEVP